MYRSIFLTFFIIFLTFCAKAQSQIFRKKIDSLLSIQNKSEIQGLNRIKTYTELYKAYIGLRMDDSVHFYLDKTIKLGQDLNLDEYVAEAYFGKAFYFQNELEYVKAETYYNYALTEFLKLNDKNNIAGIYQNLSAMYNTIPDYVKALDQSFKAIEIFHELGDEISLASCYFNIGNIYKNLKQYASSISYFNKANNIFSKNPKSTYGSAITALNIGEALSGANAEEFAELKLNFNQKNQLISQKLNKSLDLSIKHNYIDLKSNIYRLLGDIHLKLREYDYAYNAYQNSLEFSTHVVGKNEYVKGLIGISKYYYAIQDRENAKANLEKAVKLAEQLKILECTMDSYFLLSEIYEEEGDYNLALENFKSYINAKNLIIDQDKQKEIIRKQLQLDYTIKEKDLLTQQTITNAKFEKQLLLAKQRQQQLLLKEQELELADRQKNIDRLNYLNNKKELEQNHSELNQKHLKLKIDQLNRLKKIEDQNDEIKSNKYITYGLSILLAVLATGIFLIFRSHKKTKTLNNLIQQQKNELEQLNQFKDKMFTVISHDMRAPVNSVMAFTQLLELENLDVEKFKNYAKKLNHSLNYTSNMMLNLLNWASTQMKGHKINLEDINLKQCVDDNIASLQSVFEEKNISLKNNYLPTIILKSDYNMLSLILRNLINNALKFTPTGGEIEIIALKREGFVDIIVNDNGVGVNKEFIEKFNNSLNETLTTTLGTNKEKGTGLGLVLCKNFASLLNGKLIINSKIDIGSSFVLTLPDKIK